MRQPLTHNLNVVALLEPIHASAGINQLLPAGIERMTLRTDFNLQLAFYGAGIKRFAASAPDSTLAICRMDFLLHYFHPLSNSLAQGDVTPSCCYG